MKKAIAIAIIAAALLAAYTCGRQAGIHHAIADSEIWITDWTEHEDYDLDINIDLDGQWYIHECYVG